MRAISSALLFGLACVLLLVTASACGRGARHLVSPELSATGQSAPEANQSALSPGQVAWPTALPVDKLQPWEEVDVDGFVIPPERSGGHSTSAINEDSDFTPGRERFSEAGDVTNLDEASRFASGASGAELVSYAIYEVALASAQPGAVSADVNLRLNGDSPSAYWLGLSDYGNNTWKWRGPFADSHIRITVPSGDYTSGLGSFFVCVVAYDGASFDLVGLGVNPRDDADVEAPEAASAPTLTPENGGVLAEWIPVIADDLAGYKLYYADYEFAVWDEFGVETVDYLEGGTRHLIAPAAGTVYVALSAVDISGNESALSALASTDAGAGIAPVIQLVTDVVSGTRGISAQLTATGAESYDFDLDGDGDFNDLTGDPTGTASVNTDATGIIRPAVRGTDGGGGIAFAAVSLIIQVNSRPVAVAHASPASGLVPLDVTFTGEGTDDDGTIDAYSWDFDGDGTYDSMVQNPPPHTYTIAGLYNAKFRVTDDGGSFDVDTVSINALSAPTNLAPVAVLTADETLFHLGETGSASVSFDASGSYDPEDGALNYYFDPEADGSYVDNGTDTTYDHDYPGTGVYLAKLKVEDSENDCGYDSLLINVYRFGSITVDSAGIAGEYASLAVVNGNPAVSYYNSTSEDLMYVRATDAVGDTWDAPLTLDSVGDVGGYTSIAVVNGNPAISYHDNTAGSLKYVRASDASGNSWGTPDTIDSTGDVGQFTSLAVVNSYPAISYWDDDNGDLKYVRADDIDGSSWGTRITLDSTGDVGYFTSLAVVNGYPAISYYDSTNDDLKYVRATDGSGSSWDTPVTPDSTGSVGYYTSMAVVNGNPAISYHDQAEHDLKYVRASDANGSSWGTPIAVESAGWVGEYTCLAIVNGNPAISYYDETKDNLKYVCASDANGSSWGSPVAVYSPGDVGGYTSLAIVNGKPAISYYDFTNQDLKFAYPRLE